MRSRAACSGRRKMLIVSTILVEVATDAGERARAILHGVRADADLGVGEGNDVALEVGVFQHRARTCHESTLRDAVNVKSPWLRSIAPGQSSLKYLKLST